METFGIILSLSIIFSCVTARLLLPDLVCSLNRQQKRVFLECIRPFYTPEFRSELRHFLDCANLRHFVDFLDISCSYSAGDPQYRNVVTCLNRYPGIGDLPGDEIAIRRCSNKAAYY